MTARKFTPQELHTIKFQQTTPEGFRIMERCYRGEDLTLDSTQPRRWRYFIGEEDVTQAAETLFMHKKGLWWAFDFAPTEQADVIRGGLCPVGRAYVERRLAVYTGEAK